MEYHRKKLLNIPQPNLLRERKYSIPKDTEKRLGNLHTCAVQEAHSWFYVQEGGKDKTTGIHSKEKL